MAKAVKQVVKKPVARATQKKKVPAGKKAKHIIRRSGTMYLAAQEAENYLTETEDAFQKRKEERLRLQKHADSILYPKKYKKIPKTKKIQKSPKVAPLKRAPAQKTTADSSKSKTAKSNSDAAIKKTTTIPAKSASQQTKKAAPAPAVTKKDSKAPAQKTHKIEKKDKKQQKPKVQPKQTAPAKKPVSKPVPKPVAAPAITTPSVPADAPKKAEVLKKKPSRAESKLIEAGLATGMIDVVFCIDTTGSMDSYLEETKTTVNSIVTKVKEQSKGESVSVRFGVVAYRDHPPQETTYLTKTLDLSKDVDALNFLETLDCTGGGDGAEAVFDGLFEAAKKTSWRDSKSLPSLRYIFHITDAPPHGDYYQGYSELWGGSGCPCGLDVNKVAHVINIEQIHYRLVKIGQKLTKMAEQFKEKFTNYEECPIDSSSGMDIRITDMIIRELVPDMAYD